MTDTWISGLSMVVAILGLLYTTWYNRVSNNAGRDREIDQRLVAIATRVQTLETRSEAAHAALISVSSGVTDLQTQIHATSARMSGLDGANLPHRLQTVEAQTHEIGMRVATAGADLQGIHRTLADVRDQLRG